MKIYTGQWANISSNHRQTRSSYGYHAQRQHPPGRSAVESPRPGFCSKRQKTTTNPQQTKTPQQTTKTTPPGQPQSDTKLVATIYNRAYTQSPLTSPASASASASSSLPVHIGLQTSLQPSVGRHVRITSRGHDSWRRAHSASRASLVALLLLKTLKEAEATWADGQLWTPSAGGKADAPNGGAPAGTRPVPDGAIRTHQSSGVSWAVNTDWILPSVIGSTIIEGML